jgi:hypothetical protein
MNIRLLLIASILAGCGGGDADPPAGSERGPCRPDGTCDGTLICLSRLCVAPEPIRDAGPGGPDAAIDASSPNRRTYVANEVVLPTDGTLTGELGRDVDGDGTIDNQLGSVLSALASAGGDTDIQTVMTEAISRGDVILLAEVVAPSLVSSPSPMALARVLRGEMPMPAPCADAADTVCRLHLSGSGSFVVTAPAPERASGEITAMELDAGPSSMVFPLTIAGEPPTWIPLVAAHVRGRLSPTGIDDGTITGAIREADVDAIVIPAIHVAVAATIAADCPGGTCEPGSDGETLVGIYDANDDGMVTLEELRANSLIQSLLRPDIDVLDASGAPGTDGTNDSLSVGIGFNAVAGVFAAP